MKRLRLPLVLTLAALALGCSDPPPDGPPSSETPAWQVVLDGGDLDRAVLSVWGSGPKDVFAVGGPLGNGQESLVVHFDGASFRELHPGGDQTYWWVSGSGPDDVWMVGEEGRITHWDGATFTEHVSGTTATLWGVWAAGKTDAWAVGGTPEGGTGAANDVVLHWDGSTWTPVTLPGMPLGRAHYKVWGTSSDDLYVVGEYGTIWHKKGADWAFESDPPLASGMLFTVSGCGPNEVYAVGTFDVLRSNGVTWQKLDVALTNGVNGVACNAPGEVIVVGFGGSKQRLDAGAWVDEFEVPPYADLHAAWADGTGTYWAVGGNFVTSSMPGAAREGIVARYGPGRIANQITP
ncbi:hypothetical protein [Polyangium sp. y55x31]|uniref:WD40/YVTN/BNR-like repeat-containing protein n=1 Tax=Polyangium sp. y55x31 TaxID=3042688 RepID=UPI002482643F|nr:hypothetical protein [Polyangium sp. y55x31]MDI1477126.1 hypothetical protein [Polyangium sp. y55x31]